MPQFVRRKYTKELLTPLVQNNVSVAGVMRSLGLRSLQGGSHTYLSKLIKKFGLDTRHFTGRASNQGEFHRGGPHKKSAQEILISRTEGKRRKSYQLRRALIEIGRPYRCSFCNLQGMWQKKPLMLEIDHINKNFLDDRPHNLLFLCPNCHSQTTGHCGSKGYSEVAGVARSSREYRRRVRGSGGKADALRLGRNG